MRRAKKCKREGTFVSFGKVAKLLSVKGGLRLHISRNVPIDDFHKINLSEDDGKIAAFKDVSKVLTYNKSCCNSFF